MTGSALARTVNRRGLPKGTPLDDGRNERTMRRVRAAERHEARDERGPIVQLRTLDERLGDGIGATRERMRLLAQPGGRSQ